MANVAGNQLRAGKAARDAAMGWRPIDAGHVFFTDQRLAIQAGQWRDLWFDQIRLSECDGHFIELHIAGESPPPA